MAPNTNIKSYLQQQQAVAAAAVPVASRHQPHPISEQQLLARGFELIDSTPPAAEIMRSYDEIDQIYDYIRGLAPLPDDLRRMKSIDFEQMEQRERQKRIQRQQQLHKIHLEQQRKLAEEKKPQQQQRQQQQYLSADNRAVERQPTSRKSARQRQREEAEQSPAAPSLQPIRLTAGEVRRPTVKRVESLKLKGGFESEGEPMQRPSTSSKPNYLISSSQFRLPRAQSTSSLGNRRLPVGANERAQRHTKQRSQMLAKVNPAKQVESFSDEDKDEDSKGGETDETEGAEDQDREETNKSTANRRPRPDGSRASSHESADSTSSNSEKSSSSSSSQASTSSDYENKTAPSRASAKSGKGSNHEKSTNSSAAAQSQRQRAPRAMKEEHIYEQIPAQRDLHHQIARRAVEASETAPPATLRDASSRQRQPVPCKPSERPRSSGPQGNQPACSLAYSANLNVNVRHQQQVASLFAARQRQNLPDRKQHRQATLMPSSQFVAHNSALQGPGSMPRSLAHIAHHHRLSMGNLHLLPPPLSIPMATLYTASREPKQQQQQQPSAIDLATGSIGRSSSSSKVHRVGGRPPKLSPVELIARIQMPRAVSKRQVAASSHVDSAGLGPEVRAQHHRRLASDNVDLRQNKAGTHVWLEPMRASAKRLERPNAAERLQNTRAARVANKRASGRRLTAIGIEQSFDMLSQHAVITQQQLSHAQHRAALQAARANFFEPANLSKAPLIDAEEEEEEEEEEEGADEAEAELSGSTRAESLRESADSNIRQNHIVAAASVQAGHRLDSISSLHSFSSSSASNSTQSSASPPPSTSSTSEPTDSIGEIGLKASPADAVTKNVQSAMGDESRLALRSFNKCYYGQGAAEVAPKSARQPPASAKVGQRRKSVGPKSKRLGSKLLSNGERLLSLIGLDAIGSSSAGNSTKTDDKETNQVRATMKKPSVSRTQLRAQQKVGAKLSSTRTWAPPTPLTLASDERQQSAAPPGRRRFSSSAANDASGERTMSAATRAPRPSLVCHYEYPIVEVAKVPNGELEAIVQQRAKALAASKRRNTLDQQEAGSSGTTNSTSSYEAAIKNSAERRSIGLADESQQPSGASRKLSAPGSSTGGAAANQQQSSLIRVPKLSKESHLLNRPLARLCATRAAAPTGTTPSSVHHSTRSVKPSSYTQGDNQRNLSVINPQHVVSALVDRYGTARSDPSSASQSRAAQRYLMNQSVCRPLVATISGPQVGTVAKEGSPLSTNLDVASIGTGRPQPELVAGPRRRQRQQPTLGSSPSLKSGSAQSHNRLSSLGNIQPSPTVTTYTSSGISSTHLATNASSSSSQRSKGSNKSCEQLGAERCAARRAASSSSNTLEGPSSWQPSCEDRSEDDEIDMIDEPNGNSISPDTMRFSCRETDAPAHRGHLKSFDERFSNKYVDQRLASSSDSLLESINFSGTLESRKRRYPTTTSTTTTTRTNS